MVHSRWAIHPLLACLLLAGTGCDRVLEPHRQPSAHARAYLEQVLDVMQAHSVQRLEIDWPAFRARVEAEAAGARSVGETNGAITTALGLLGDDHSFLRTAGGGVLRATDRICVSDAADVPRLPPTIGYLRVAAFAGSGAPAAAYAATLQAALRAADDGERVGWIVDLRGNGGGNMWPMLAGVGPLLGEGGGGFFVDPAGGRVRWDYRAGAARLDGAVMQRVDPPHTPSVDGPRVAVLLDGGVASSGEAIAIAFRGRPQTRSFGAATCGLATANAGFPLSDGAVLYLTVATIADRELGAYPDGVVPDEVWPAGEVVRRAVEWLEAGTPRS